MSRPIDPESPVPLYHQIAEAIRARIEDGELRAGDTLDPMRRAAERWGVNLHTVRHAYAALAREGLLEMRSARGTRVTERAGRVRRTLDAADEDARSFVARFVREAAARHGIAAPDLAALVASVAGDRRPVVAVVECSLWQCAAHAAEIEERFRVDARPWPLDRDAPPEGDAIVATYFHYNDIRRRWPELLAQVRFLTIRVDPSIDAWLADATSAVLVERDEPTAQAVAADLRTALGRAVEIERLVTDDPARAIASCDADRLLFSPRVWSQLDDAARADERCAVVRYEFDRAELEDAARDLGWSSALAPLEPSR